MTSVGYGVTKQPWRMLRASAIAAAHRPATLPKERPVKIQKPGAPGHAPVPDVDWDYLQRVAVNSCRHIPPWVSRDDLVQEASLAGWRAANRWRPDGGSSFTPFVMKRALGAVRDVLRDNSSVSRAGLARPVKVPLAEASEPVTTDRDTVLDIDLRETLERALACLSPKQRHVIVERFLHDRINDDVGRDLGISGSAVSLLATGALERLRRDEALRDWVGLAA
jgi:RNA polymerase sigma factor (sigma-70 family)